MLKKMLRLGSLSGLVFLLFAATIQAQTGAITGKITNANGEAVPTANVVLVESGQGAATNLQGVFTIENVEPGTYTLRVTFVGYAEYTAQVSIEAGQTLEKNITMQPSTVGLEELVVTGIVGERSKATAQIAVSKVDAAALQETKTYATVSELLTAKAGVNIQRASGTAGASVRFNIRGGGTLGGATQPIIYINGTRVSNATGVGLGVGGQTIGVLSSINPTDIKSIEILKGPAAAALYGSRGANGVVLITTKTGAIGDVRVNFNSTYGINTKQDSYKKIDILSYKEADQVIGNNPYYENTVSVSGGTQTIRYFTSLNQRHAEGLGPDNILDRQNFNGSFQAYPNDNLVVSANTSYTLTEIHRPQNDNNIFGWLGNLILAPNGNIYNFTDKAAIEAIKDNNNYKRFIGSLKASWTPTENLSINGSIGYDDNNLRQSQYFSPEFSYVGIVDGQRSIFNNNNEQITYDANIEYRYNPIRSLQVTSIVGTQIFNQRTSSSLIVKQNFPSSQLKDVGTGAIFINGQENNFHSRDAGVFTKHSLAYNDTYYLTFGGRIDYASAIGDDAPVIFYPSIRAAIRLEQFDFLPKGFDLFKIRAAYGETGSLPALFDGVDLLYGAAAYGVGRGAIIAQIGNPKIEPERVKELVVGLDLGFFNNYSAGISYYNQQTEKAIINFQKAPSTGLTFDNPPLNVGGMKAHGFEFNFSGSPLVSDKYQLNFNLTASYDVNEVTDLRGAQPIYDGFDVNVIKEGLPSSAFYTLDVNGAARDANGNIILGSDGSPVPNISEDRVFLGIPYPKYSAGLSLTFRFFKNFSLYQLWDYAGGLSVYNNTKIFTIRFNNNSEYNAAVDAFNNATTGTEAYKQAADRLANLNANYNGNFVEDADYLKLREVSLSYDFTPFLVKSGLGDSIRNLRLTVAGRNLLTFTKYSGIDPEVNFNGARSLTRGGDFMTLQNPRTFYVSLNVGF